MFGVQNTARVRLGNGRWREEWSSRKSSRVREHFGFEESDEEHRQNLLQGNIRTSWQHSKRIQPSQTKAQSHSRQIN